MSRTQALGLKLVNTDKSFETGLKKAGQTLDLKLVPPKSKPIRRKKRQTTRMLDRYIDAD